ncbi:MAG: hypothetical protein R3E75_10630 [Steroidobacteraceae bacterium]|nr:hypothetical protein [Nevskiaceae bacterium]
MALIVGCLCLFPPAHAQDFLGSFLQAQQDANIREIQQGEAPAQPAAAEQGHGGKAPEQKVVQEAPGPAAKNSRGTAPVRKEAGVSTQSAAPARPLTTGRYKCDLEAIKAALRPAYERRVKTHGREAANAWLEERAVAHGRNAGLIC